MAVNTTPFPAVVRQEFADFLQSALSGEDVTLRTSVTASEDVTLHATVTGAELELVVSAADFEYYAPRLSEPGDSLETSGDYFNELGAALEAAICAYFPAFPLTALHVTFYDAETRSVAFMLSGKTDSASRSD
jgi:hypothetical protein